MTVTAKELNFKKGLFICEVKGSDLEIKFYRLSMKGLVRRDRQSMKMMFSGKFAVKEGKFQLYVDPGMPDTKLIKVDSKKTLLQMKLKQKLSRMVEIEVNSGIGVESADASFDSDSPENQMTEAEQRQLSEADEAVLSETAGFEGNLADACEELSEEQEALWKQASDSVLARVQAEEAAALEPAVDAGVIDDLNASTGDDEADEATAMVLDMHQQTLSVIEAEWLEAKQTAQTVLDDAESDEGSIAASVASVDRISGALAALEQELVGLRAQLAR
ncbi:MAG: hypothetical protein CL927_01200 [Deltaproteobacteria bacterium]|nr:hypothetical protein [Deltaproteobacteria bacterium]HCH63284.1 hypothetical protein [Deltaproteobacteria bacterium]